MNINKIWKEQTDVEMFSGVFSVRSENAILFEVTKGFRNRSEKLPNKIDTAFGIASGT